MILGKNLLKRVLVLAVIFIIAVLPACADTKNTSPASTATPAPSPVPSLSPAVSITLIPSPTQTPSPTPAPKLSYTTGLPFDGDYKPVMVDIENSPAARPQLGLQTADVVYEVPVEGGVTRFVCVFSDNVPDKIMPVRSGRVPFLYIQHEWDAIFMHYGGSGADTDHSAWSYYGNPLRDNIKIEIDGLKGKWDKYFYRKSGVGAPHNVVGNPKLAQQLYNYDPKPVGWLFASSSSYTGDTVTDINLSICTGDNNFVSYKYDPSNDVYLRSMDGKAFMSAETGKQLSVKNLIVQYATYDAVEGGRYVFKLWDLIGTGKADIYIGGVLIKGSWEREAVGDATVFKDDKGNQIVLRPGNTWIEISTP